MNQTVAASTQSVVSPSRQANQRSSIQVNPEILRQYRQFIRPGSGYMVDNALLQEFAENPALRRKIANRLGGSIVTIDPIQEITQQEASN